VGAWLASRSVRDEVVLYAKGCHPPHCSPSLVAAEVDKALADLGVDQLDVFTLHRDDTGVPVELFAEALVEQVEKGKVAGFGVSNWTMLRFRALAGCLGGARDRLVAFSNHFSLGEMVTPTWPGCLAMTKEDLDELAGAGVEALAWASLASGYFAGREVPSWDSPANDARRGRARELAEELGGSLLRAASAAARARARGNALQRASGRGALGTRDPPDARTARLVGDRVA